MAQRGKNILLRGPKILEVGQMTSATPPFGQYFIFGLLLLLLLLHDLYSANFEDRVRGAV